MDHCPTSTLRRCRAESFVKLERGASLIELMVGLTIGLLVVMAALGTVTFTNTTAAAVSDTVRLNLQAQSVFDTLGRHLRQSSSHTMTATGLNGVITFQNGLAPGASAVAINNAGQLMVSHGTQIPTAVPAFAPSAVIPGCLGVVPAAGVFLSVNTFSAAAGVLSCSEGIAPQPIADNVEAFVTRFGTRNFITNNIQYLPAAAVINWQDVEAIEVCLQLSGDRTNTPNLATYNNCQGVAVQTVDGRLHRVFRRVFTVRPEFRLG